MHLPTVVGHIYGDELIVDIGIGNRNNNAYAVVFAEPMSFVDQVLGQLARSPSSTMNTVLREHLRRTGRYDLHRLSDPQVLSLARSAFIQRQLVIAKRPRILGSYALRFDGTSVELTHAGQRMKRWSAVSGKPGFQTVEHQGSKDIGPLPEGAWLARQAKFERIDLYGSFVGFTGRGTWPGSTPSWGRFRIWLEPVGETKTFDRSGFSIHGGATPGSAGCIDLTSNVEDFARHFLAYGKDLLLVVTYPVATPKKKS